MKILNVFAILIGLQTALPAFAGPSFPDSVSTTGRWDFSVNVPGYPYIQKGTYYLSFEPENDCVNPIISDLKCSISNENGIFEMALEGGMQKFIASRKMSNSMTGTYFQRLDDKSSWVKKGTWSAEKIVTSSFPTYPGNDPQIFSSNDFAKVINQENGRWEHSAPPTPTSSLPSTTSGGSDSSADNGSIYGGTAENGRCYDCGECQLGRAFTAYQNCVFVDCKTEQRTIDYFTRSCGDSDTVEDLLVNWHK